MSLINAVPMQSPIEQRGHRTAACVRGFGDAVQGGVVTMRTVMLGWIFFLKAPD